jgi:hypothetical protein
MPVNPTVRSRLEAQGFCGLDDARLEELAPWMRWTYTIGTVVTVTGVVSMSPSVPSFIYNTVTGRRSREGV